MANRYSSPVMFAMEKNLTILSAHVTFGASGVAVLDTQNSKGICNFAADTLTFSANSVGSSATMSSVTSFRGLYNGMVVSGGSLPGSVTISSMTSATNSIVLSTGTGVPTNNGAPFFVQTGRYRIQFGSQAGVRLDPYAKFLGFQYSWDMSSGSAIGTATSLALAPLAPEVFIHNNLTKQRTIPATATSGSADCSLLLQMGVFGTVGGAGNTGFTVANPAAGEGMRFMFFFGNSTAL